MPGQEKPKTITIEVNGQSITTQPGKMLIQVTDQHNIYIPRFCYHKKLSVAANCRMCLVDVEGARKPSPACATPISDGMKVFTKSPKTLAYQKSVMEFLLINHPLDCPICDQGGECELQDLAMGYGKDVSSYTEKKRALQDPDLGPLVATEMTRCICCTRCVRFGEEISGMRELGGTGRGEYTQIGTYIEKSLDSELSGNVIDICPVGALTSKPFQFEARAWELQQYPTISPGDGIGANMYMHTRRGKVFRAVPRENESLNEVWLSDRDRFAYEGLNADDRVTQPMIKKNDDWVTVSWEEAIEFTKEALTSIVDHYGGQALSALSSESSTTEEMYLLQKIVRSFGSDNIDVRLNQGQLNVPITAGDAFDCDLEAIEKADSIVLIGSFLRKEVPLLNHRVRKAQLKGAKITDINPCEYHYNFDHDHIHAESRQLSKTLLALAKALHALQPGNIRAQLQKLYATVECTAEIKALAKQLHQAENPVLILGQKAITLADFGRISTYFSLVKELAGAHGAVVSYGANAVGAKAARCLPYHEAKHREGLTGKNAEQILSDNNSQRATILLNTEPEKDSIYGRWSESVLKNRDLVISLTPFASQAHKQYCDVILPITPYTETSGTYINFFGEQQHFSPVVQSLGESKPGWKVLRVLGNFLELDGFDYASTDDIMKELDAPEKLVGRTFSELENNIYDVNDIDLSSTSLSVNISMYDVDMLTRRSEPLQQTNDHLRALKLYMSPEYANHYDLSDGDEVAIYAGDRNYGQAHIKIDPSLDSKEIIVPRHCYGPELTGRGIKIKKQMQEELV